MLDNDELQEKYIHTMTTDRLQMSIAREYIENDVLTMFTKESLFRRITFWQILTIILAIMVENSRIVLGTKVDPKHPYEERCKVYYE